MAVGRQCWRADGQWGQRDGRQRAGERQDPDPQVALASPHSWEALGMGPMGSLGLPPSQGGPIVSRDTGRCLEVEMSKDANFGLRLVVQRCSGQKWTIRNWIKPGRH